MKRRYHRNLLDTNRDGRPVDDGGSASAANAAGRAIFYCFGEYYDACGT